MSLVDYASAVRRRPVNWRRFSLQPGLWLAWLVMTVAVLMDSPLL